MITQSQITKNIDPVWDIVNEHLEAIHVTKHMPVLWCVHDNVFTKYHRIEPVPEYIRIDKELVVRCPMILASYSGLNDEATADEIHMRDHTSVYCTDNNIVFHDLSHIFSRSALWLHAKCDSKARDGQIVYKHIQNHFFGRNTLGNRDSACGTKIEPLE